MKKTAYERFTAAQEATLLRINQLNDDINANRAAHAKSLKEFDTAMLAGDDNAAKSAREQCEKLDRDLAWLQRTIGLLSKDGGRGDPAVVEAGKQLIAENRAKMEKFTVRWEYAAEELAKHREAFMALVAELGKIDREARKLRAQAESVFAATGINAPWIASPADRVVNMDKQTGIIYIEPRTLTQIFKRGKV